MALRDRRMLRRHISFEHGEDEEQQTEAQQARDDHQPSSADPSASTIPHACARPACEDSARDAPNSCTRESAGTDGVGVGAKGSPSSAPSTSLSGASSQASTALPSPALSRATSHSSHAGSQGMLSLSQLLPSLGIERDDSELAPSSAPACQAANDAQLESEGDCWAAVTASLPQRSFCEQLTEALEVEAAFDEARELAPPLIDLASLSSDQTLAAAKAEAAAAASGGGGGSGATSRGITPRPTHRHRRTLSNQVTIVPAMLLHGGGPTGQLYSSRTSSASASASATPNMQSTPVVAAAIPSALCMPPSIMLPSAHAPFQQMQMPSLMRPASALALHFSPAAAQRSLGQPEGTTQAAAAAAAAAVPVASAVAPNPQSSVASAQAVSAHAAATAAAVALTRSKRMSEGLPPLLPVRSVSPSPTRSPIDNSPHLTVPPANGRRRSGSDGGHDADATALRSPSSALPPPHSAAAAAAATSAGVSARALSHLPWLSSARSNAEGSGSRSRRSQAASPVPGSTASSSQTTPASQAFEPPQQNPSPPPPQAAPLSPLSRYSDDNAEFASYRRAWELGRHLHMAIERLGHPPHYSRSFFFSAPAPGSPMPLHADAFPPMHGASPRAQIEALVSPLNSALGSGSSPSRRRASTNMLAPDHSSEPEAASSQPNQGDSKVAAPILQPRPSTAVGNISSSGGGNGNGHDGAPGMSALLTALGAAAAKDRSPSPSPRSSPRGGLPPRGGMLNLRSGMSKRASMPIPLTPTASASPMRLHSPSATATAADSGSIAWTSPRRFEEEADASGGWGAGAGPRWSVVPPSPVSSNLSRLVCDASQPSSPSATPRAAHTTLPLERGNTVLAMLVRTRLRGMASAALAQSPLSPAAVTAAPSFSPSSVGSSHWASAVTPAAIAAIR